eukprot:TRINITY_DN9823_c0_g1_i2.p1 TRINITY_DN9823_c0_g1~~TRINITY_DN9823_c0_g1_i2.p1  ORF type:complete len:674 (+),score=128.08 TRINITY_DN9823_c0_g1_i2:139-2160(+)
MAVDARFYDEVSLALHRLLAEERTELARLVHGAHMELVHEFETKLPEIHKVYKPPGGFDRMWTPGGGPYSVDSGAPMEETFATTTRTRFREPSPEISEPLSPDGIFPRAPNGDAAMNGVELTFDRSLTPKDSLEIIPTTSEVLAEMMEEQVADGPARLVSDPVALAPSSDSPSPLSAAAAKRRKKLNSKGTIRRIDTSEGVSLVKRLFKHPAMECIFSALIFTNAVAMGLEQQYSGIDIAYKLQVRGATETAEEAWPHAEIMFLVAENFFGAVFTAEVILKMAVFRSDFFKSAWNLYDTLIIVCWFVQSLSALSTFMHPLVLRLARMGRLLRLLRFAKAFQVFDVLHLLVRSLSACMTALMWSALFLLLVMMGTAIVLVYSMQDAFEDENIPLEERKELFRYFGNFTNGMFAMYELTMGNWVPISRAVIENVSQSYMLFFVVYRTLVGFALLKVVTAIFNAETFRVAQSDDGIMVMHKERQIAIHTERMEKLLHEGDESQDGYLNLAEFKDLLEDKRVQRWLAAQDIEVKDSELAFRMIDVTGDGKLSAEELVRGFARLKGTASSMDMVTVMHAFYRIEILMDKLQEQLLLVPEPVASREVDIDVGTFSRVLKNNIPQTFLNRYSPDTNGQAEQPNGQAEQSHGQAEQSNGQAEQSNGQGELGNDVQRKQATE